MKKVILLVCPPILIFSTLVTAQAAQKRMTRVLHYQGFAAVPPEYFSYLGE